MTKNASPSAFSSFEIRLDEFIDLEEFPIHDLTSPRREMLVNDCRKDLEKWGCAHIPNFITSSAVQKMRDEAFRIMAGALRAHSFVNPYLPLHARGPMCLANCGSAGYFAHTKMA